MQIDIAIKRDYSQSDPVPLLLRAPPAQSQLPAPPQPAAHRHLAQGREAIGRQFQHEGFLAVELALEQQRGDDGRGEAEQVQAEQHQRRVGGGEQRGGDEYEHL